MAIRQPKNKNTVLILIPESFQTICKGNDFYGDNAISVIDFSIILGSFMSIELKNANIFVFSSLNRNLSLSLQQELNNNEKEYEKNNLCSHHTLVGPHIASAKARVKPTVQPRPCPCRGG
jgi:hypothetical protein